jgi:hypothetical protein
VWTAKQAALVSGTNIKTINSTSLLGNGNIAISGDTTHSVAFNRVLGLEDSLQALRSMLYSIINAVAGCCDLSDNTPPAAPTSLLAFGKTTTRDSLHWTDPADYDLDSIRIYRAPWADSANYAFIGRANEGVQYYLDNGRSANTAYWYKIKAVDDSSNVSGYSNRDSAKTLSTPPSSGSWVSIWTAVGQTGNSLVNDATEYDNFRMFINKTAILRNATALKFVIQHHSTTAATISGAAFGEQKASSDIFDFNSAPTRITFNAGSNGSGSFTGDKTSDSIAVSIDSTKNYLISLYYDQAEIYGSGSAAANNSTFTKDYTPTNQNDSQTSDVATYGSNANMWFIKQILGWVQ